MSVHERLDEFAQLQDDWDCDNGLPIKPEVIAAVRAFVESLPDNLPTPQAVPMSSGNVQLEWNGNGRWLELEFESATDVHYLEWDGSDGEEGIIQASDMERLLGMIARLEAGQ